MQREIRATAGALSVSGKTIGEGDRGEVDWTIAVGPEPAASGAADLFYRVHRMLR